MQPVSTRAGLVYEPQLRGLALEPTNQSIEVDVAGTDFAHEYWRLLLRPRACATAIESLWTSNPTNSGVDWAMADLREHRAADHAAMRLWPAG
jgi:hypothetical protein